jgi:hypothetical protein
MLSITTTISRGVDWAPDDVDKPRQAMLAANVRKKGTRGFMRLSVSRQ